MLGRLKRKTASPCSDVGFRVFLDVTDMHGAMKEAMANNIAASEAAVIIGTPLFKARAEDPTTNVAHELRCIQEQIAQRHMTAIPLVLDGTWATALPASLTGHLARDMRDATQYLSQMTSLRPLGIIPALLGVREGDKAYQACIEAYRQEALMVQLPPRNPLFCGRDSVLQQLETMLKGESPHQVTVAGLGGIGKTQLVVEFAHRHSGEYKLVRWLAAEGGALRQSVEQLAVDIGVQPQGLADAQLRDLVYTALGRYEPWLLVLDNADGAEGIKDLLPTLDRRRAGQHVLITSRSQLWPNRQRLAVDVLSEGEALEVLRQRCGECESQADGHQLDTKENAELSARKALVAKLGFLPLAIAQAAAYMKQTGRATESYLQLVERAMDKALGTAAEDYPHTVAVSLGLSVEQLRQSAPEAWRLLQLCAFVGPDDIPRWLCEQLLMKRGDAKASQGGSELNDGVDDALVRLREYSLVQWGRTADYVSVHRLVQLVTRLSIAEEEKSAHSDEGHGLITAELLHIVATCLRAAQVEDPRTAEEIQRMRDLVTHMEATAGHLGALCGQQQGEMLRASEKDYLQVMTDLGAIYFHLGDPHRRKALLERALPANEKHFGPDHYEVATILDNLANACGDLGDVQRKKELLQQALAIKEKHYGPDHNQIAMTLNNLANAYGALGDVHQMKDLLERALVIKEKHCGPNHYQVAITLDNLGNACGALGDVQRQKEVLERALAINEKHYGPDHYRVATTLGNLSIAYGGLGDFQRKKELLERALAIEEKHYGPDHFNVALTLDNLGNAYGALGDAQRQKELLERALAIEEKHYGPDNYHVAITLVNLSTAYSALGDVQQQKELLERALAIEEKHYGSDHYQVAIILANLATALGDLGDAQQMKTLLERALFIQEKHYGPDHYQVAVTMFNLAMALESLGGSAQAASLVERVVPIFRAHYGADHDRSKMAEEDLVRLKSSIRKQNKGCCLIM